MLLIAGSLAGAAMASVDLAIQATTATASTPRLQPGRPGTVSFFTNNYGDEAVDAVATVPLPAGSTYVSTSPNWLCALNGDGAAVCIHTFAPHSGSTLEINFIAPEYRDGIYFVVHPQLESLKPDANPTDNETILRLYVYRTFEVTTSQGFAGAIVNANATCDGALPCLIRFGAPMTAEPIAPLPRVMACDVLIDGTGGELSGAKMRGGWANGLVIDERCSAHVRGLTIRDFPQNGIVVERGNATIESCTIVENGWRGIAAQSPLSFIVMLSNRIADNRYSGVAIWAAHSVGSRDNTIEHNGASGIFVNDGILESFNDRVAFNHDFGFAVGGAARANWSPELVHDNGARNVDWYLDGPTAVDESGRMPPVPQLLDAQYDAAAKRTIVRGFLPAQGRQEGFVYVSHLYRVVPGAPKVFLASASPIDGDALTFVVDGDVRGATVVAVTASRDHRVTYTENVSEESAPLVVNSAR